VARPLVGEGSTASIKIPFQEKVKKIRIAMCNPFMEKKGPKRLPVRTQCVLSLRALNSQPLPGYARPDRDSEREGQWVTLRRITLCLYLTPGWKLHPNEKAKVSRGGGISPAIITVCFHREGRRLNGQ
jgi:hypothetical protein